MIPALVGVPIKPFGVAKRRLDPVLDPPARARLGRAVAANTLRAVAGSGAAPVVVTGDDGVAAWARAGGWDVLVEPPVGGLDAAAGAVVAASPRSWAVVHADLPLVTPADLMAAWAVDAPAVLAPSADGGTNLFAGTGPIRFAYGPGSCGRHLARAPGSVVVARPGLALDLDTPGDLEAAVALGGPPWLLGTVISTEPPQTP